MRLILHILALLGIRAYPETPPLSSLQGWVVLGIMPLTPLIPGSAPGTRTPRTR
jgi:hypothetical protein